MNFMNSFFNLKRTSALCIKDIKNFFLEAFLCCIYENVRTEKVKNTQRHCAYLPTYAHRRKSNKQKNEILLCLYFPMYERTNTNTMFWKLF